MFICAKGQDNAQRGSVPKAEKAEVAWLLCRKLRWFELCDQHKIWQEAACHRKLF